MPHSESLMTAPTWTEIVALHNATLDCTYTGYDPTTHRCDPADPRRGVRWVTGRDFEARNDGGDSREEER